MALFTDSTRAPGRALPPGTSPPKDRVAPTWLRRTADVVALAVIAAAQPMAWGRPEPGLWYPAAGAGLALLAWRGAAGLRLILVGEFLALLGGQCAGTIPLSDGDSAPLYAFLADSLLGPIALALGWWLYHRVGRGARGLVDPNSAILFLLLIPGLAAGLFAGIRAGLTVALQTSGESFLQWLAIYWLSWALGVLVVAPPLLIGLSPWLVRKYLALPEETDEITAAHNPVVEQGQLHFGDWLEILGLAAGASLMGLLLAATQGRRELAGWQLWGAPQLLIFWASLRQGLRGGSLVAGAAAALPLLALSSNPFYGDTFTLLIQGNLLATCCTGLLVAASASWIRASETRYRQAVTHTPVVIYSARILRSAAGKVPEAEVSLVSAATTSVFGCPPEQLLGDYRHWLDIVHPEDRVVLQAALTQLDRQSQPVTCEYRLKPKALDLPLDPGSGLPPVSDPRDKRFLPATRPVKWVRDTLAPQHDAEGRLIGWEGVVMDITEQRSLADDLRRTTSMFHALVANLPAGVFFVQGKRGRPILVNARARQLLGQREDTAAGLEHIPRIYQLYRPDGTPYPLEELPVYRALRFGNTTMRDDIVVHRPDGRRTPLVTWAAPIHLSGTAQADAAVWVLEDLTALHQAESARRDTECRLQTVIETMGEGLIVHDRLGAIRDCNPAAAALLGRELTGMRGRLFDDIGWTLLREDGLVLPEDEAPVQAVVSHGRPVRNMVLGLRARADSDQPAMVRWLLVNAMPLGSIGSLNGVVTTFTDITASRRAQEVIRQSEEKYRGLVESLPLMLVQTDRDLRLIFANPAFKLISGYDVDEVAAPLVWQTLILPEDLPQVQEAAAAALQGQMSRFEARFVAKDGSEKFVYGLCLPRSQEGAVLGLTALVMDMTRERNLEADLQRAQRLELIGRLSSGIAHDFNNMLTVVLSSSEMAHSLLPVDHPAQFELRRIGTAADQAAGLAGQLLAFSKQRRVVCKPVEVNRITMRTLELLRPTLPVDIRVAGDLEGRDLLTIADETQLQQVLMNLCLNARDAMPQGGEIRIQTLCETTPPNGDGRPHHWIRLSVRDSGQGMSDQVKARIFDPFFSTKENGTGLGLAVVQQIVDSFGGRVEVSSQPGAGARFDVWLPSMEDTNN